MSLAQFLPPPRQVQLKTVKQSNEVVATENSTNRTIPPYGKRKNWIPRSQEDFGDGGAYPEVHVAQYPLDMGKKGSTVGGGNLQASPFLGRADKQIQKSFSDTVETVVGEDELTRPDAEKEKEITDKTKSALEKLVELKVTASTPSGIQTSGDTSFIRYTPTSSGLGTTAQPKERIIRLTNMAPDPLEPAKFKHKKAPQAPPSPPAPVMHSPPRKPSAKDIQDWTIPPCISNWKNNKGYTIPLDKRLAADGRGLQEVTINDNFAKISEALYLAERNAREEVAKRAELERRLKLKEKEKKEELLRKLAQDARLGRTNALGGPSASSAEPDERQENEEEEEEEEGGDQSSSRLEREKIRQERRKERERDLRLQRNKSGSARNLDRDVTERVALGMAMPEQTSEVQYDQRLFNQSQGLDSGFGDEDSYNLYSKPLFQGSSANQIYRPKGGEDGENYGSQEDYDKLLDTSKFRPDKGFSGTQNEDGKKPSRGGGPLAFEQDKSTSVSSSKSSGGDKGKEKDSGSGSGSGSSSSKSKQSNEDVFGIDAFLSEAKTQSSQKKPLDKIGQGGLHAASTSSGSAYDSVGSKRSRINFQPSGGSSSSSSKKSKYH